jgi:hypothetical protein
MAYASAMIRSAIRSALAGLVACVCLLLVAAGPSYAEGDPSGPPDKCLVVNEDLERPKCTSTLDGEWNVSYPGDPMGGAAAGFAVLFVLTVAAGIGFTLWRVSTTRSMARRAGMDPDEATAMTLLSDDGFEATYLAANLRGHSPPPAPESASVGDRLRELQGLRDEGLVTPEEYDERRRAILDDL